MVSVLQVFAAAAAAAAAGNVAVAAAAAGFAAVAGFAFGPSAWALSVELAFASVLPSPENFEWTY